MVNGDVWHNVMPKQQVHPPPPLGVLATLHLPKHLPPTPALRNNPTKRLLIILHKLEQPPDNNLIFRIRFQGDLFKVHKECGWAGDWQWGDYAFGDGYGEAVGGGDWLLVGRV